MSIQSVHNYKIFKAEKQKYEIEDLASLRKKTQVASGGSHNVNQFALQNPKKLKMGNEVTGELKRRRLFEILF